MVIESRLIFLKHVFMKFKFSRVDYLDSFGRTRRCIKKDLPLYKQQDEQIKAKDYNNFVKGDAYKTDTTQSSNPPPESVCNDEAVKARRQQWEEEEAENMKKSNLHYQDVLYQGSYIFLEYIA